jgi:hypothetical protein
MLHPGRCSVSVWQEGKLANKLVTIQHQARRLVEVAQQFASGQDNGGDNREAGQWRRREREGAGSGRS